MSSYNYNQPPPYRFQAQDSYGAVPVGTPANPRLPQYHHPHRHHRRNTPGGERITFGLLIPTGHAVDYSLADARALDRFWSTLFLGVFVWLAIISFTDGVEMMRLAAIGLAAALKAVLDAIIDKLRESGWVAYLR